MQTYLANMIKYVSKLHTTSTNYQGFPGGNATKKDESRTSWIHPKHSKTKLAIHWKEGGLRTLHETKILSLMSETFRNRFFSHEGSHWHQPVRLAASSHFLRGVGWHPADLHRIVCSPWGNMTSAKLVSWKWLKICSCMPLSRPNNHLRSSRHLLMEMILVDPYMRSLDSLDGQSGPQTMGCKVRHCASPTWDIIWSRTFVSAMVE